MIKEIIALSLIGIALSMDTFSASLSIGMTSNIKGKKILISFIVGIFHFLMPLIGYLIGVKILKVIKFNPNILISLIFFIIALEMIFESLKKAPKIIKLSLINIFLFSISVSLDSFTTGIGILAISNKIFLSGLIFSIFSFSFTYLGLVMGNYLKIRLC